jgi:hypothetical protein
MDPKVEFAAQNNS